MTPKVPKGWTVRGELPKSVPATAVESELDVLDEDLIQVVDPSNQYTLDVGWYPAASRTGQYICRLVRDDNWLSPIEQLETRNREIVRQWLIHGIEEIHARLGQPGEFSTRVGVFISRRIRSVAGRRKMPRPPIARPLPLSPTISSPAHTGTRQGDSRPTITSPSSTSPLRVQPALQHAA